MQPELLGLLNELGFLQVDRNRSRDGDNRRSLLRDFRCHEVRGLGQIEV